ncbi:hypothetical protein PQE66_gp194 [Bacillus phage PBC2]|uniref:Uncharacterized protein n=1 Tax=Bacillus phage PBC2 TaxID=1675029 RepID=A0A218KC83_9CAUD|nr:hypothetical protein PQE66_gp194 [Bacillus phage PBC2]AKQ08509.1 hypothetical protein PBC2_194 [Bacillus phage PBC2]
MFKVGQTVFVNQYDIMYMGKVVDIFDEAKKLLLLLEDNGQIAVDMKYCTIIQTIKK